MRTRSKLALAKTWLGIILFFIGVWSLGLLKIALIGSAGVLLLVLIIGSVAGNKTSEQPFKISAFYPPSDWKSVHDAVWDMFMTGANDKDEAVVARFLRHINAVADEQHPLMKEVYQAIYFKMAYEHQRLYQSLQYTYGGGLHVITGPETMRPLSDDERTTFLTFCQEQLAEHLATFDWSTSKHSQQTTDQASVRGV